MIREPLVVKAGPPAVTAPAEWEARPDGSLRSGNVVIRRGVDPRYSWPVFLLYRVRADGSEVLVWPRSRPWPYCSAGYAKRAARKILNQLEGESVYPQANYPASEVRIDPPGSA